MKRIIVLLFALALAGFGCTEGDTIISGSSLRPDNFPGDTAAVPPPTEIVLIPSLASDMAPLPGGLLAKRHGVGQSPCPDPFPQIVLPWPDGQAMPDTPPVIYPESDSTWLSLPETVTPDEPFTLKFNCRISDRSPHQEIADVMFRVEGHLGSQPDDVAPELQKDIRTYNLPVKIQALKIELDIE